MITTAMLNSTNSSGLLADHWQYGPSGFWPIFPLIWLLIVAAIVTTIVLTRRRRHAAFSARAGEAKLAELFAAGEITTAEYRERRDVLRERRK